MIHFNTKVIRSTLGGIQEGRELIIQQGGTNSGKTFGIIAALIAHALASKEKHLYTIAAVNFPYVRRDPLRAFFEIIAEMGVQFEAKSYTNSTFQINGSTFEFIGMEDPMKASHGKRDFLYINEAYLLPYMVYKNLSIRTKKTVILDYNPHEEFWLHDQVLNTVKAGSYLFKRSTYKDNPAVPDKVVREIELLKSTNESLYRVLGLGLKGKIEGLVFPNITLVDSFPDEAKKVIYGIDFGYTNDPTACVKIGLFQGELYLEEIMYETGLLTDEIIQNLYLNEVSERDLIVADSAAAMAIGELRKKGINIQAAVKGKDSVIHGINLVNQYRINVVRSSNNLRKEQRNYRYKTDKSGKYINEPIDQYNHCWDAVRYAAARILTPKTIGGRRVLAVSR